MQGHKVPQALQAQHWPRAAGARGVARPLEATLAETGNGVETLVSSVVHALPCFRVAPSFFVPKVPHPSTHVP